MTETATIRLPVYRTPDGKPTCGVHIPAACQFLDHEHYLGRPWCRHSGEKLAIPIDPLHPWYPIGIACPLWSHADRGPNYTHSGDNGVDCGCRK